MDTKKKTVFVGVSGGVDSSVSAALLKDQGYHVVGVFIRTWTPDFIECTWRDERRDAMRVCAHLDIPFLECDAEAAYKKGVADYMIEEYKKGNTPNPDVMCNREVKFGVFWDFAQSRGADYIATGHYARVEQSNGGAFSLKQGIDSSKDQSYFLWTLNSLDLSHTLFPIGHLQKTQVRRLAKKFKLPTATKKDSQGVCFLGPLDMKDFLSHYITPSPGTVLDEKGKVIGSHDGAWFFTLGERHGFSIIKNRQDNVPLYVIKKDIDANTITVGPAVNYNDISNENKVALNGKITLKNLNWIREIPMDEKKYTAQIRYHGKQLSCTIYDQSLVFFDQPILVSSGQSIVVYDKDECIGGGVVV